MKALNKNQIFATQDQRTERVLVPEWDQPGGQKGVVYVRTLTAAELDEWEASQIDDDGHKDLDNLRARLAVVCCVDEQGNSIFDPSDADMLGQKNAAAVDRIADVAMRMNRRKRADLEELAKNCAAGPNAS